MEQLSFDRQLSVNEIISQIADEVCSSANVNRRFLNVSQSKAKESSENAASLWIKEPINLNDTVRIFRLEHIILKTTDRYEVEILPANLEAVSVPECAEVKITKIKITDNGDSYYKPKCVIKFTSDIDNMIRYLRDLSSYCLSSYKPSASNRFGCCDKYVECSNALKCLHRDEFYSRCCWYRRNLEAGKVFYGKNRNV